jgi:hypothetical protein
VTPNTAPGAERLAGGVEEDAAPAAKTRPRARAWRWAGAGLFLLVIVVLLDAYLHLSKTYPENSDEANILLMANDMLHGNVMLHNWSVSDVPFISTELPQIALLVWMFGLHLNTAHIAAAVTYTLIVAVGLLLAKGKARGWAAVARMALALGIMLAPQPGVGVFVVIFSVGHIGTALPVLLTWLVLDRLGRKWYTAVLVAVLLGWALTADPLVLVVAIFPVLAVCLARVVSALVLGAKEGGLTGLRAAALDRWFEVWLAAAAGIGYVIAWGAGQFISNSGGFVQQPVPYHLEWSAWLWHSRVVVHGLLEMFGAYFVPGTWISFLRPGENVVGQPALSGLDQAIALTHLVGVVLAVWGACAIARRFFFRDADIVSQLLLAGIVANLAAYIPSTLANATALNVREIAPVLPFAAVLAGRMLGDRVLTGPVARVRLPAFLQPVRGIGPVGALGPPGAHETLGAPGTLGAPEALGVAQETAQETARADGMPAAPGTRRPGPHRRSLAVRLVSIPLVLLFGWYSFGLFRQADTPAAAEPLAPFAAYLEAHHLSYGLGGYWEASLITVMTDGAVTIRAVTPACVQPYPWESKKDWYDQNKHVANFIVIDNLPGYFSQFDPSGPALTWLNTWSRPPYNYTKVPVRWRNLSAHPNGSKWPAYIDFGGYYNKWIQIKGENGHLVWVNGQFAWLTARVYPVNLLAQLPKLKAKLSSPTVNCG